MQKPSIGRIVHFTFPAQNGRDERTRPAVVVEAWSPEDGYVNLHVFIDGMNDADLDPWQTSVYPSPEVDEGGGTTRGPGVVPCAGHWHWPPRV